MFVLTQFKSQLAEGNIVQMLACYSFNRIETLKSEKLFTYLNLNARRGHSTGN